MYIYIYKVYLNPANPSMILPPAAARLFARWNFRSKTQVRTITSALAITQV